MGERKQLVLMFLLLAFLTMDGLTCSAAKKHYVPLDPISAMEDVAGVRRSINSMLAKRETGLQLGEPEMMQAGGECLFRVLDDEEGVIENAEVHFLLKNGEVMDVICVTFVPPDVDPYTLIDGVSVKVTEALLISLGVEKEEVAPMITAGTRGKMYAEKFVRRSCFLELSTNNRIEEFDGKPYRLTLVHVCAVAPQF